MTPSVALLPVLAQEPPAWAADLLPWVGVLFALLLAAGASAGWVLVVRARELESLAARLEPLEEIRSLLARFGADRDDLDLRRLEHVLVDIRDAQARLEDALLRTVEASQRVATATANGAPKASPESFGERVTNRLLALGFERVRVVTGPEELERLAEGDGEVVVEAERFGAHHKGRVLVRGGVLTDVEFQPTYGIFP